MPAWPAGAWARTTGCPVKVCPGARMRGSGPLPLDSLRHDRLGEVSGHWYHLFVCTEKRESWRAWKTNIDSHRGVSTPGCQ